MQTYGKEKLKKEGIEELTRAHWWIRIAHFGQQKMKLHRWIVKNPLNRVK